MLGFVFVLGFVCVMCAVLCVFQILLPIVLEFAFFLKKDGMFFDSNRLGNFKLLLLLLSTVSLTEFESFFCNLERYVGTFCATHRLERAEPSC